ncbi:LOW QUALITY PROTEIN: Retrovirus-related Pol Polyprotein [Phytophthora palmivora]|uniref:Retrovirus-related Pol Polyprotein n=1 Tax=Phytophthora palmivora TaxID=4796 RepID=A0A2P4YJ95_9STRA|nr:LOW QUALITY PROTEIN: Retrovirus-related Pol Polyprotein [Phytophthora palmivora]
MFLKMLQAGVLEEGNGAWGFPVVLVRKKVGEVRFCVDYCALNKVTKRDGYPVPRVDETLEALQGARLFSTLDLRSGCWQIGVAPEDRDKTTFTTKQGLYRFIRTTFGLMNAPSTFQRMMNGVLHPRITCLVYLDDFLSLRSRTPPSTASYERLPVAGLTLKLKKCAFATRTMEYLGDELNCDRSFHDPIIRTDKARCALGGVLRKVHRGIRLNHGSNDEAIIERLRMGMDRGSTVRIRTGESCANEETIAHLPCSRSD